MVSDASKKKAAAKKAAAAEKRGSKAAAAVAQSKLREVSNGVSADTTTSSVSALAEEMAAARITDRTCTGVLASHPQSRDIHVTYLSINCPLAQNNLTNLVMIINLRIHCHHSLARKYINPN